jgi:hypothetical protein
MEKLRLEDSIIDIIIKMSNDDSGATVILSDIIEQGERIDPYMDSSFIYIFDLDEMEIYGTDIWILYEDVCDSNVANFIALLRSRRLGYTTTEEIKEKIRNQKAFDFSKILSKIKKDLPDFLI